MPTLRVLKLTECRKLADIAAVAGVPCILGLRIALCNRIEDYSPLERLEDLRVLTIEANRLASLSFLQRLPSLQDLALPVGRLDDKQIPDLRHLVALRQLSVPKKRWSAPLISAVGKQLPNCEVRTF